MNDDDLPSLFRAANKASAREQFKFFAALAGNLLSLIVAAAMSVVNDAEMWFAWTQVVILLVSLALASYLAYWQPQKLWYGMRALSESVKTSAWRWMMRAEPYESEDEEARQVFVQNLRKTFSANIRISERALDRTGQVRLQSGWSLYDRLCWPTVSLFTIAIVS